MTETADAAPVGPYAQAALRYWTAGWHGALPLPARKKANPPDGWTGHKNPTMPSRGDIQSWLETDADGNIGLRLPRHIIGIDVDNYGDKQGRALLDNLIATYGELPATWTTSSRFDTGSGIALFQVPEGLQWPGKIGDAIEIIQFGHRYAVVWPSIHPEGRIYRWYDPTNTVVVGDIIPGIDDIPPLPATWITALTGGRQHEDLPLAGLAAGEIDSWITDREHDGLCARMGKALASRVELLAAPGASRHDTAVAAIMYMVRLVGEGHHGGLTALNSLRTTFNQVAASDPKRTQDPAEWPRMIKGAVDRVAAMPAAEIDPCTQGTPKATLPTLPALPTPLGTVPLTVDEQALANEMTRQRATRKARRVLDEEEAAATFREPIWTPTLTDELALPDDEMVYTVADVLPAGANVLLVAQFKAGKTTLVNNLTRSLVDGPPFLGQFTVSGEHRIGIFNYEVGRSMYRRWMRDAGITNTDQVTVLNLRGLRLPLIVPRIEDWVVRWLVEHRITCWVVDPFAGAFVGSGLSENDNGEVGRFLDALDTIKNRAGVSELIMPTHTGRVAQEAGYERARGASRLDDWADVRWILTTDKDKNRYFRASGRDVEFDEVKLGYDESTRRTFIDGPGRARAAAGDLGDRILAAVRTKPGINTGELKAVVGGNSETIGNKVADLVSQRKLRLEKAGRAHLHYLANNLPTFDSPSIPETIPNDSDDSRVNNSGHPERGRNLISSEIILDDHEDDPPRPAVALDRDQLIAQTTAYRAALDEGRKPRYLEDRTTIVDKDGVVVWSP